MKRDTPTRGMGDSAASYFLESMSKYSHLKCVNFFSLEGRNVSLAACDVELLIRNASDGKNYLYDIVNIKENTTDAIDLQKGEIRLAAYKAASHGSASVNSVAQQGNNIKVGAAEGAQFSLKGVTEDGVA